MKVSDRGLKINSIVGNPPSLSWIAPADLKIDEAYQRSLGAETSISLIRRMAADWDWRLCQPIQVARRTDGSLWIVDGQHRHAAAELRGDIPKLPCVVAEFANMAEEAAAFVRINKERRGLNSVDVFKANLAAGQREAVEVNDLIHAAGLTIAPHSNYTAWKPGMLYCIPGICAAYRRYGKQVTSAALVATQEAFDGKVLRYAGQMLRGLFRFYAQYLSDPAFDPDAFIERLSLNTQEQWMRLAAERIALCGDSHVAALTEVFIHAYKTMRSAA